MTERSETTADPRDEQIERLEARVARLVAALEMVSVTVKAAGVTIDI
jgi:hypothetical protein